MYQRSASSSFFFSSAMFLIKPKDIDALKNKLEILIENENLRKELGNNAYNEVIGKFNWEKSIEKYAAIFEGK